MNILLSNDDGVYAWGLEVLYRHLKKIGKVWVVAPLIEKSTTGHSLTLHKPLRLIKMDNGFYGVSGSPADCIYMGIREVMKKTPDIVISGINRGANMGQDVYLSGTVSAAREGCILGIPAIAVSTDVSHHKPREDEEIHFDTAARAVMEILKKYPYKSIPKHTMLNVNAPDIPYKQVKGYKITKQGFRYYNGAVVKRTDHRGKPYFWIGGQYRGFHNAEGTDCHAVANKHVSVTPIRLDCTNHDYIETLESKLR